MSDHLLTKCPHCSTTFRLTQEQLDIAGGAVRCGACYQVFHANQHIVKTSVVEEHRKITKEPDPIEEAFDLKSDEGLDPYEATVLDMESTDAHRFAEEYRAKLDEEEDEEATSYAMPKKKRKEVDESWAEEMLRELGEDPDEDDGEDEPKNFISSNPFQLEEDEEQPRKANKPKEELSDTFKNLGRFDSDNPFSMDELDSEEDSKEPADDESWARALLEELEREDDPSSTSELTLEEEEREETQVVPHPFRQPKSEAIHEKTVVKPKPVRKPLETAEFTGETEHEPTRIVPKPKAPAAKPTPVQQKPTEETEAFFNMLDAGADEPVTEEIELTAVASAPGQANQDFDPESLFAEDQHQQLRKQDRERSFASQDSSSGRKNALLAVGCLVLVCTLVLQYVYFHFEDVARQPELRPWMAKTCAIFGCTLPNQVDVSQIVGTNLVVRSHPTEPNALAIDVILKNRASFEQPYPLVQLNFEDINGNPVASRRFRPDEYIQDANIDPSVMPSNVPIHLTLEIVDPGRDAVNYQLLFLPNNKAS